MSTVPMNMRIKEAMQTYGISQAELARRTEIDKSSLSNYLSGKYKPKQNGIYKIANALNVSEAWLMGFNVPMQKEYRENINADERLSDETTHLLAKLRDDKDMTALLEKYYSLEDEDQRNFVKQAFRVNVGFYSKETN